jgi:hypothetical protein
LPPSPLCSLYPETDRLSSNSSQLTIPTDKGTKKAEKVFRTVGKARKELDGEAAEYGWPDFAASGLVIMLGKNVVV